MIVAASLFSARMASVRTIRVEQEPVFDMKSNIPTRLAAPGPSTSSRPGRTASSTSRRSRPLGFRRVDRRAARRIRWYPATWATSAVPSSPLSEDTEVARRLFEYRFGVRVIFCHTVGNLLLTALSDIMGATSAVSRSCPDTNRRMAR